MFFAWIAFMGLWWWFFTIVAVIVLIGLAEEDMWGFAILATVVYLLLTTGFGTMPIPDLSPMEGLKWFGGFMGIGLTWSYFKWFTKLRKYKNRYKVLKLEYEKKEPTSQTFKDYLSCKMKISTKTEVEWDWTKHRITFWICFWPFSVLNFCLHDLMRFIVEDVLKGTYMKLRKMVLGDAMQYVDD